MENPFSQIKPLLYFCRLPTYKTEKGEKTPQKGHLHSISEKTTENILQGCMSGQLFLSVMNT
jgi:hypothetical protein